MRWLAFPKMALGLTLAALAACALVSINEVGFHHSNRALAEIGQAQRARLVLSGLMQIILDAEMDQRSYVLTGEERYRQLYDGAAKEIDSQFAMLRTLYAGRTAELARLTSLANHVLRKQAEMDKSVRLRKSGAEDAWKFVMATDVGREEMDAIRTQASNLVATSDEALYKGRAQIDEALKLARIGIAVVALAALIAFYLYLRQSHALQSAGARQQLALQRERNALEDEVRDRTATLAELATHLQDVRETEKSYLARELHDELGSLLTAAKLDVARLKSKLVDSVDATQRLQHLTDLLNSGIALKRRIIEDLRPSSLSNLGLIASLEILGREFADRSGMKIEMALEPVVLDEALQLTIYRMVQESLTNISKYAEASEATIVLKNHENHVVAEVRDNGKGFDPREVRPATHGLAGMRHRVEAAHGKLTITSTLGQGTLVSAMLPAICVPSSI